MVLRLYMVGAVLNIFSSKWGFMFLVIFPTLFALVYEIYSVVEEAKRIKKEDDDEEEDKKDEKRVEKQD